MRDAIDSVLQQAYPNIELIVVDDSSDDNSQVVIQDHIGDRKEIIYISLKKNLGNCKAFNTGWLESNGDYIIDLAADDLLLPERVAIGVDCLQNRGPEYGVHFSDAQLIDKNSKQIGYHLTRNYFENKVPEGYLFRELLAKYFINPVSMMYTRDLLDYIGGYNELLAYEDFDLWVRTSKQFKYCYTEQVLVAKRLLLNSHGGNQYIPGSEILKSTFSICEKAYDLCDSKEDYVALNTRIKYEMRQAAISFNLGVVKDFYFLRKRIKRKLVL